MTFLTDPIWWKRAFPFYALHLVTPALMLVVPFSWEWIALGVGFYYLRMFALSAGFHRYFSHKTYKTSRAVQFLIGLVGCLNVQRGPIWWAAHHRRHHRYSGQPEDVHSPEQYGFYTAHVGWALSLKHNVAAVDNVRDLTRFPELHFLERIYTLPAILLGLAVWYFLGPGALVWGYLLSLICNYHGTFTINSLCHMWGSRRFETSDDSRNNLLLAILTMGEGWHNNHHFHQSSARQGLFWWELDPSYWLLRALQAVGIIWDLKEPPRRVYEAARRGA